MVTEFKKGMFVSTDVAIATVPFNTYGIVSHAGVDDLDGQAGVVVRFEDYPAALYSPNDLTEFVKMPLFDLQKAQQFKPGEMVQAVRDIDSGTGKVVIQKDHILIVTDVLPMDTLAVHYWGNAQQQKLIVGIDEVRDYFDTRFGVVKPTPKTINCKIPTCAAENDYGVKVCWKCGNSPV